MQDQQFLEKRAKAAGLGDIKVTWLMLDGDDLSMATKNPGISLNNYPDPLDNHGASGANANFCDGHAEWVSTVANGNKTTPEKGDKYWRYRELSQDEGTATKHQP